MRNNETGEFELVVGNKQLLSGFFIVVLLFAVAFAMGYVVGQNSPRSAKLASEAGGWGFAGHQHRRCAAAAAIAAAFGSRAGPYRRTAGARSHTADHPSCHPGDPGIAAAL